MNYSQKILELQRQFENTQYQPLLKEYYKAYSKYDIKEMDGILARFPAEIQLLETLVEKLKGKSVYSNLKKIVRGESISVVNNAIGTSSLITHVLIEVKQGNTEYKLLLNDLNNKLNKLVKEI